MALTVKDILELPSGQKLRPVAGEKGHDRPVISVEIADYEFATDVEFLPGADLEVEDSLEPDSFIITSFLFAKDDPDLIINMVETLERMGMSALAYKQVIYDDLPEEVIAFAEKKKFPIFSFDRTLWFENIIFDIMYAVQFDDRVYLSEEKIDDMLSCQVDPSEVDIIRKGISLKLQPYVSLVYVAGDLDTNRLLRSFYMQKGLHNKGLATRYGDGLFLIITSPRSDHRSHDLIRREIFEILGIPDQADREDAHVQMGMSNVLKPEELDRAFRQSWFCYLASVSAGTSFERFGTTGIYRAVLPAMENEEVVAFAREIVEAISINEDIYETAREYIRAGGEIVRTSETLCCHQNTVRYRLTRIRALTGLDDVTDGELYLQIKAAFAIHESGNIAASAGSDRE